MRNRARIYISAFFYYSGLIKLIRSWVQRSRQRLIILYYHQAAGGDLRGHLLYLRHHYRMLQLEEALEELYGQQKERVSAQDPRPPLVLTFDDGYHDNYTHAFVLACELQVPITISLIPGYVESGKYFWWQERERLVRRTQVDKVTIEGQTYHLRQEEQRVLLAQKIYTHLRHASSVAEREEFLTTVCEMLAVPSSVTE